MSNQLLIQYFHWYYNEGEPLWERVTHEADRMASLGITGAWLPPAYKATTGGYSVGYDCYDLFDLGEFDQKGSVPTRYGTRDAYLNAIKVLKEAGISTIADVVFNHKAGADELEKILVRKVDPDHRTEFISEVMEIEAWTRFTFPGRKGLYSDFIWDHRCFSGIDRSENPPEEGIFSIQNEYGEGWEEVPSLENGNYDYLMFNDIEFRNPAVREELKRWGEWYYKTCGMDGFRLDAVKHIAVGFLNEWLDHMKAAFKRDFFVVAENWTIEDVGHLEEYLQSTNGHMQLFDSILHHNLYTAGKEGEAYDLSRILEGTLVSLHPELSVTFVDNHDSQPLQALESYIDFWFRPLAYALILLREQGIPCLFYPDLYGCRYTDQNSEGEKVEVELVALEALPVLCQIRKEKAYGTQRDYFDYPSCIGWTREGLEDLPGSGLAVVMSNGSEGSKYMEIGATHAGRTFIDALGNREEEVVINEEGCAEFTCPAGSLSVWVIK